MRIEQKSNRYIILPGVLVLTILTGIIAGNIFKKNVSDGFAASKNITVTQNDQTQDVDQSTGIITLKKRSTVNVTDPEATTGYLLSAQINQNTIEGATITIGSDNPQALHCTLEAPCQLYTSNDPNNPNTSNPTAPLPILYPKNNNNATLTAGDTSTWEVTITIPAGTNLGSYIVDIAYSEQAVAPMQNMTYEDCTEERQIAYDVRNSQVYYIQKIPGSGEDVGQGNTDLCWMESDLRYAGGGDNTYGDTKTVAPGSSASFTEPLYYDPEGSTNFTNTNPGEFDSATGNGIPTTYGFYGYLYNWCAANGGQANACQNTAQVADTTISICPSGWRLPSGLWNSGSEFYALNGAVNGGDDSDFTGLVSNFLTVWSGFYSIRQGGLVYQSKGVMYWVTRPRVQVHGEFALDNKEGEMMDFQTDEHEGFKDEGNAVRCVLPPLPTVMQDNLIATFCDEMPVYPADGGETDLRDTRDNKIYKIRKLADGNCWMVDNLSLQAPINIYYSTSDVNLDIINLDNSYKLLLSDTADPNSQSYCSSLDTTIYPHKCGLHYTWTAATAGTGGDSGTASSSICPGGWRLPANGEYTTLQSALGWGSSGDNVNSSYWRGLYAGQDGSRFVGTTGRYWSATAYNASTAYYLYFYSSGVGPSVYYAKTNPSSVRCLAR